MHSVSQQPTICECGRPSAPSKPYMNTKQARMCQECRTTYERVKDRKRRGKPAIADADWQPPCACGAPLVKTSSQPKRVCEKCQLDNQLKQREQRPGYGLCQICGKPKPRPLNAGMKYCAACSDDLRRARNRRKNVKRRAARLRGRAIESEPFTTREIAERDNWICHLCKRKVTKRELPKGHPRSATIDHLIPVSADGDDVRANVALAHWSCNSARSDRGPAQLRLIG